SSDPRRNLTDRLESMLRDRLTNRPAASAPGPLPLDWPTLVRKIGAIEPTLVRQSAPADGPAVTVCVLHRNRLAYLAEGLASIPTEIRGRDVELLVVDNASDVPFVEEEIRKLAGQRKSFRVIRFDTAVPQAFAFNRGATEARGATVVFLDDDNYFAESGV